MPAIASATAQSGGFGLKHQQVELIPQGRPARTFVPVEELEATRVERAAIPASKHGLEAICGASCDTGAQ